MLVNSLFSVCFATGYIHFGEIKIFKTAERIEMPFGAWTLGPRNHVLGARISLPRQKGHFGGHTLAYPDLIRWGKERCGLWLPEL